MTTDYTELAKLAAAARDATLAELERDLPVIIGDPIGDLPEVTDYVLAANPAVMLEILSELFALRRIPGEGEPRADRIAAAAVERWAEGRTSVIDPERNAFLTGFRTSDAQWAQTVNEYADRIRELEAQLQQRASTIDAVRRYLADGTMPIEQTKLIKGVVRDLLRTSTVYYAHQHPAGNIPVDGSPGAQSLFIAEQFLATDDDAEAAHDRPTIAATGRLFVVNYDGGELTTADLVYRNDSGAWRTYPDNNRWDPSEGDYIHPLVPAITVLTELELEKPTT